MKLKALYATVILTAVIALCGERAEAQIFDRIKKEVKTRAENKVVNKAGNSTDKALDKLDKKATEAVGGSTAAAPAPAAKDGQSQESETAPSAPKSSTPTSYASYDFVPGDRIIFQPDLSKEADAELPARFIIDRGNAEIQTHEGEKILHLNKGGYVTVLPLMNSKSYLPEQFTLEFDLMYENEGKTFNQVNDFSIHLFKEDDENYNGYGLAEFIIRSNQSTVLGKTGTPQNKVPTAVEQALMTKDTWHHVALYVRNNIAKAYIGPARVSATNNFPTGAAKLAIQTDGRYGFKIKNFRLAAGGDDKYQKIVTEGKFITHGILFDVNKSAIKPESAGTLNEIAKLMKDHADLKFEINGHTDSDGKADANQKLSEERAAAVKSKLVEMGIDESRLTTKGNGAAKPIAPNDTAEGKANNRRVEFVKM